MSVRHRQRPRFQVDDAELPQIGMGTFRVAAERRHKRQRFRVEPADSFEDGAWSSRAAAWTRRARVGHLAASVSAATAVQRRWARSWARHLVPETLGERRRRHIWALYLTLTCFLLAAAGGIVLSTLLRPDTKAHPATAASGGRNAAGQVAPGDTGEDPRQRTFPPFQALQLYVPAAGSVPPAIQAASAFVFDPDRGLIFYQKDADQGRAMASTTKVMTLLLASRYNLDQMVSVGPDAAALVNGNNSYMGLGNGEQLTLRDLLYGLIVASGNDAAVAIADGIGGSEAGFVALMNREARLLGLTHTSFVTPDGLDDGNQTSARDLAVLSAIAVQDPAVEQITATRHLKIPATGTHRAYEMWSTNDLLPGGAAPYLGAIGVKTGYTEKAQYCMAFAARLHGHLMVGVVLGDSSVGARNLDAHTLLDWAFAQGG